MKKGIIDTESAPEAIGPYSQGVKAGNLLFTSGQIPINPETGKLVDKDIGLQAKQVLDNLKAVLEAGGSSLSSVIKTTVFIKDINDFAAVNQVYSRYFKGEFPARSCIQAAALPMNALIEIEAIAIIE